MIRITVMRTARYDDLSEKYENPIEHACDMRVGDIRGRSNASVNLRLRLGLYGFIC